ncbi:hypothetical protein [Micromonospora echinofusca]|uniref:Uncharacterized protein n=1 Tax=Micromonospora echinofusca TaxID=47858 RepID=A0ABS3VW65_MICEH|nr:hypothetical protein [Micromonospora echinofusca]MBO4208782.1 hypothetical protein [Micromonospora echinofusca]
MIPVAPVRPSWWMVCRSARLVAALALAWVIFAVGAGTAPFPGVSKAAVPSVAAGSPAYTVPVDGAVADGAVADGASGAAERPAADPDDDPTLPDRSSAVPAAVARSTATSTVPVVPTGARCAVDSGPRPVRGQRAPPLGCPSADPARSV